MKKLIGIVLLLCVTHGLNAQGAIIGSEFMLHDEVYAIMQGPSSLEDVSGLSYTFTLYVKNDTPAITIKDGEGKTVVSRVFEHSVLVLTGSGMFVVLNSNNASSAAIFLKESGWVCCVYEQDKK